MGVYDGSTYGAFSGLGKPSIKLEFEDNEALLDFQRRMQEGGDGNDDPDGDNFTPSTYTQEQLDNAVKNQTVIGWSILPEIPDGWQLVKTSVAPKGFNVITKGEPAFKITTEGWKFEHSLDAALIEKKKGLKVAKGDEEPVEGCNFNENSLGAAGDLYLVRDMRTRSRKEPGELATNKNMRFINLMDGKIKNFNKDLYYNTRATHGELKGFKKVAVYKKDGNFYISYRFFVPTAKFKDDPNAMAGTFDEVRTEADINKIYNMTAASRVDIDTDQAEKSNFDSYKNKFAGGSLSYGFVTADYYKELQQKAFYTLFEQKFNNPNSTPYTKKMFLDFYANPTKYKIVRRSGYGDSNIPESWNKEYEGLKLNASGLAAPGDVYLVTDTRQKPRKDLDNVTLLKKYDIRKLTGEELAKMQTDDPLLYEQIKADLGKTANPAIYNNNDIMECRGLVPTYTILDNYSSFFEQAKDAQEFAGFGLDDTLKLIDETCRKHWKDCAKIAAHLKGDCKLQSAFNLWHWMRHNIRYEYDREGREEVRTPLRVWADRHRGVDCDCLSVFAYCVLRCMGYNPAFELVAFRNKPQYSHIFINLDGIVVDRVWFIFNSRPPMVTKRAIHRINEINDLGKLF